MKSNVEYSTFSWMITFIVTVALVVGLAVSYGEAAAFFSVLAIVVPMYVACLFFAPMSISADRDEICIHSSFRIRSIPMADVVNVERYRPLPGTLRTCASGGFMGYWGTFHDSVIGNYTGFWGKDDDCFLVTLASDKKYLLGCRNPDAMVGYIKSQMNK